LLIKYMNTNCFLKNLKFKLFLRLMIIIVSNISAMLIIPIVSHAEAISPSVSSNTIIGIGESPSENEDSLREDISIRNSSSSKQREAYDSKVIYGETKQRIDQIKEKPEWNSIVHAKEQVLDINSIIGSIEDLKALSYECIINRNVETVQRVRTNIGKMITMENILGIIDITCRNLISINDDSKPDTGDSTSNNKSSVNAIIGSSFTFKKGNCRDNVCIINSTFQNNSNLRVSIHSCAVFGDVRKQIKWIVREETLF